MIGSVFGSVPVAGRRWAPQLIIGEDVSPAEEFIVDPFLPPIATDPLDPRRSVVIPNGRLVAIGSVAPVGQGSRYTFDFHGLPAGTGYKTFITTHNGRDTFPAGIAPYKMFKFWPEHPYNQPVTYRKHALCAVPYIPGYNDAHGDLFTGDKITGYFGSKATTGTINPIHVGKPVKWLPRTTYAVSPAARTTTVYLTGTAASKVGWLPGITPTVIIAGSEASAFIAPVAPLWDTTNLAWYTTLAQAADYVLFTYGHGAEQIAGEVVRVENLGDISQHDSWLRWVEDNYGAWEAGPMLTRVPTQQVTETIAITAGVGTLSYKPIDFRQTITVSVSGSYIDENGATVTLSAVTALPGDGGLFQDYSQGKYHSINFLTGQLVISPNVTITAGVATVSYNYEVGYEQGRLWGGGQINLTDASQSNAMLNPAGVTGTTPYLGLPSHLDIASVIGELRFIVY